MDFRGEEMKERQISSVAGHEIAIPSWKIICSILYSCYDTFSNGIYTVETRLLNWLYTSSNPEKQGYQRAARDQSSSHIDYDLDAPDQSTINSVAGQEEV